MKSHWLLRCGKALVFLVLGAFVLGGAVMVLWNAVIPDVFHGPALLYWQAVGLLILTHLLFRGGGMRLNGGWNRNRWRKRFEAKLATMTPEEQETFKAEWKKRCGYSADENGKC